MKTSEKLNLLAEHLKKVKPETFKMNTWYESENPNEEEWTCGTAACAFGHACFIPEFKEEGLHITVYENSNLGTPVFKDWRDIRAAENFFRITTEEAYHLFYTEHAMERTRKKEIAVIETMARKYAAKGR